MTQTGITEFQTYTDTPPKPALKSNENNDEINETIAVIQTWSEKSFRREAKRTLEAMHYISDDPDDIIDELIEEGQSPIKLEVTAANTRAEIHGHFRSIENVTAGIDAAVSSDAATTGVITPNLTNLGRDIEEVREQLDKLLAADVTVDIPSGTITPGCREAAEALLAGIEATGDRLMREPDADELVNDAGDGWTGRPPVGFEVEGGKLRKSDDYADVRRTLKSVIAEQTLKAAAARKLDCSAKTITRCIEEHPDRYQL